MQQNNNRKPTKAQGNASANAKGKQEERVSAAKQENASAVSAVKQVEQAKAKTVSAKKKTAETKTAANRLKAEQAQAEKQKKQAEITDKAKSTVTEEKKKGRSSQQSNSGGNNFGRMPGADRQRLQGPGHRLHRTAGGNVPEKEDPRPV